MGPNSENCEHCYFFMPSYYASDMRGVTIEQAKEEARDGDDPEGCCHRFPPVIVELKQGKGSADCDGMPSVRFGHWCGEFKHAPDITNYSANQSPMLSTPLLNFSVRARKVLGKLGVKTIGDIATLSEKDICSQRYSGPSTAKEIREKIAVYGMRLRGE